MLLDQDGRSLLCSTVGGLLSDAGVPIEQIARLVGHSGGSTVTETVYRKQLRPVIEDGATVMDRVFGRASDRAAHRPATQQQQRGGPTLC